MSAAIRQPKERATPYSCSAKRRKRATPVDISQDFSPRHEPTASELKVIKGILHKTWTLYWVSPLWKFSLSSLTTFSHTLSQFIAAHNKRNIKTEISASEKLGRDGSTGIEITLSQDGGSRLVTALLCAVSSTKVKRGFTSLPLLLMQGNTSLSQLVRDWLQTSFDCCISPYSLEQDDLSLLLAQYATIGREGQGGTQVELVYDTPERVGKAGLSNLTLTLPSESVATLWDSVSKTVVRGEVTGKMSDQREAFLTALTGYLVEFFHLKMESFKLSRVTTPVLHADKTGHIKFHSPLVVLPVLLLLQRRSTL